MVEGLVVKTSFKGPLFGGRDLDAEPAGSE